ncbi:MAG: hypothetical protein SFW35_02635 [Chitinophagales bacterium]|nr:hypothetical protein [Chitinophagales bacterium]
MRLVFFLLLWMVAHAASAQTGTPESDKEDYIFTPDSGGIKSIEQEMDIKLGRKKQKDVLTVKVPGLAERQVKVELTTLDGLLTNAEIDLLRNTYYIDLGSLPAGQYLLRVYDYDNNKVAKLKVSKG